MRKFFVLLMILSMAFVAFSANQLEIFSWWTGGGEEEGLLALFDVFHKYYPDVEIINATVAGGAGTNAKAVLKTRMLGGNPPDSFQVHGGMELIDTYVPNYALRRKRKYRSLKKAWEPSKLVVKPNTTYGGFPCPQLIYHNF